MLPTLSLHDIFILVIVSSKLLKDNTNLMEFGLPGLVGTPGTIVTVGGPGIMMYVV